MSVLQRKPVRLIDEETLDLLAFLDGRVEGFGVIEDRFGRLRQRFHVLMEGRRDGERLAIEEWLTYGDGAKERRRWTLERGPDGRICGTADGIAGPITARPQGVQVVLDYRFPLPVGGGRIEVRVRDTLTRINARVAVDRAILSKWGVKLAELSLVYEKRAG
jgi:hypothetical protein